MSSTITSTVEAVENERQEIKAKIKAFFDNYPYSKFTVKTISKEVLNDKINNHRLRAMLLELCDRTPYSLRCRKSIVATKSGNYQAFLFWKNHNAVSY